MPSNYPPGMNAAPDDAGEQPHKCSNGHRWVAHMYNELGGGFYHDDNEAYCPVCGEEGEHN